MQKQTAWGWNVAFYLFLAGMGAGAYCVGAILDIIGLEEFIELSKIGVLLGFPLVFIGTFFLIADLGVKTRLLRVYFNPAASWISRGTFIISVFMILGAVHICLWIWPFNVLEEQGEIRVLLSIVNIMFAFLTMVYTALLLGAARPISMWSTSILPVLFVISGVSTGIMAILLVGLLYFRLRIFELPITTLIEVDILFLMAELIVLFFYIQAAHRTSESRASAFILLDGELSLLFWGGVVFVGLFAPLIIEIAHLIWHPFAEFSFVLSLVACLCGIIGGLLLRYCILACGVKAPLKTAGFEIPSS